MFRLILVAAVVASCGGSQSPASPASVGPSLAAASPTPVRTAEPTITPSPTPKPVTVQDIFQSARTAMAKISSVKSKTTWQGDFWNVKGGQVQPRYSNDEWTTKYQSPNRIETVRVNRGSVPNSGIEQTIHTITIGVDAYVNDGVGSVWDKQMSVTQTVDGWLATRINGWAGALLNASFRTDAACEGGVCFEVVMQRTGATVGTHTSVERLVSAVRKTDFLVVAETWIWTFDDGKTSNVVTHYSDFGVANDIRAPI